MTKITRRQRSIWHNKLECAAHYLWASKAGRDPKAFLAATDILTILREAVWLESSGVTVQRCIVGVCARFPQAGAQ